jgi:hypothetical protein
MPMKTRVALVALVNVPAEFAARNTSQRFVAMVISTFLVPSPTIK